MRWPIIVIGGGIAGLSAAWGLCRAKVGPLLLLEHDAQLFAHASGRNAAIYRPAEELVPVAALAMRSARHLDDLFGARERWLREDGLALTSRSHLRLLRLANASASAGVGLEWLDAAELVRRAPALAGGHAALALWVARAGVLDLHAIATALATEVRAAGGRIELARRARVVVESSRVVAVEDEGVERHTDTAVIAAGAWASDLGAACGAPMPLAPSRRHLALVEPEIPLPPGAPTVWDLDLGAYLRPECGAVLASPGDSALCTAEDPSPDPTVLEVLAEKLASMAPSLASAGVRRLWACRRTFAPDGLGVVGQDARVRGLFWLAGLGGHGMSAGVALGEVLAAAVSRGDDPLRACLSPARFHGADAGSLDPSSRS